MSERGFVVWRGPSPVDGAPLVCILTTHSSNVKTGDMMQVWILREDVSPKDAMTTGQDRSYCGTCPLQGLVVDGRRVQRGCYVNVYQAPLSVWNAYHAGVYGKEVAATPVIHEATAGRGVRLGAYGDPGLLPYCVLDHLTRYASTYTGYTHQWRYIDHAYADFLMASVEDEAGRSKARGYGYRSFVVSDEQPERSVLCAASRDRNALQCVDCGMCAGTRSGTVAGSVDVWIAPHGSGAKWVGVTA